MVNNESVMGPFKPITRHTNYLLPPLLDDWLPEQHLARFIVDVVGQLDMKEMERTYRGTGTEAFLRKPCPNYGHVI